MRNPPNQSISVIRYISHCLTIILIDEFERQQTLCHPERLSHPGGERRQPLAAQGVTGGDSQTAWNPGARPPETATMAVERARPRRLGRAHPPQETTFATEGTEDTEKPLTEKEGNGTAKYAKYAKGDPDTSSIRIATCQNLVFLRKFWIDRKYLHQKELVLTQSHKATEFERCLFPRSPLCLRVFV